MASTPDFERVENLETRTTPNATTSIFAMFEGVSSAGSDKSNGLDSDGGVFN